MNQAPMDESSAKTLLALWLALKDTEVRLSPAEASALQEIGNRLNQRRVSEAGLKSDRWESIEKDLMVVIQGNANLNQAFQEVKPQLDEMDDEELLDLMPSETKLKQEIPDIGGVVTYDSVASANKAAKESGVLDQLLVQLRREMSFRITDAPLVTVGSSEELSLQQAEDDDAAFDLACALVDELELGWESEWQQAAITDWEASGW